MGYAAAIAWFLFLVILTVTLLHWRYSQRLVFYG
jgi:ABC-type sugar transport system permease subunit